MERLLHVGAVRSVCAMLLVRAAVCSGTVDLEYTIRILPEKAIVEVEGQVTNAGGADLQAFKSSGMGRKPVVSYRKRGDSRTFGYELAIQQSTFTDLSKPVMTKTSFTSFCNRLLAYPVLADCEFGSLRVSVVAPEHWNVVTTHGVGRNVESECIDTLLATMICAGDYATQSFELPHANGTDVTKVLIALRGKREWDDKEFADRVRRMIEGQMELFAGTHPAERQFLALHMLGEGERSRFPGRNRRRGRQSTIVAVHKHSAEFPSMGMLAHEHFHNWLPGVLKSDLGQWFSEGVTDYMAYSDLVKNGLYTREQYAGMLSSWFRQYHHCRRSNDTVLMPYRRGALAALVLDIELHKATNGKRGIADLLKSLLEEMSPDTPVQRGDVLGTLKKLSGQDMEPLYRHLVEADEAIGLANYLKGTGFHMDNKGIIRVMPETGEEKELLEAILQ